MLDVASFVLQTVKTAYEVWKKEKISNLDLTDEAKRVLKMMQSDKTENGVFIDATTLGMSKFRLLNVFAGGEITTTRRVIIELEAKGIVRIVEKDRIKRKEKKVELTHFGWILNPDTGQVDRIG